MERPIRLRDLPGIAEIELKCKSPSYFDERNKAETLEEIDRVSVGLFSLPYWLTQYDHFIWDDVDDAPSEDEWETILWNAQRQYNDARQFWDALGWDLTDENGTELDCAHWFARQIILAESGWIEGVELTPDGSGSLDLQDNEPLSEDELAERLASEAQAFLLRRNARGA